MIEKMRDGCAMSGAGLSKLRRFAFVAVAKRGDKNRHNMLQRDFGKRLTKMIFQQALVNRFGMAYTLFHKTSLLIRVYVCVLTTVYACFGQMSCFFMPFRFCAF